MTFRRRRGEPASRARAIRSGLRRDCEVLSPAPLHWRPHLRCGHASGEIDRMTGTEGPVTRVFDRLLARARVGSAHATRRSSRRRSRWPRSPRPPARRASARAWIGSRARRRSGLEVRIDEAGNVIGAPAWGDEGVAPVVVCAHLDTVFPSATPLLVERGRDRLTGPGIGDNARGLAGMLAIAESIDASDAADAASGARLRRHDRRGRVRATCAARKHLFATAARDARAAIALDGAGDERVVHARARHPPVPRRVLGPGRSQLGGVRRRQCRPRRYRVRRRARRARPSRACRAPRCPSAASAAGSAVNAIPEERGSRSTCAPPRPRELARSTERSVTRRAWRCERRTRAARPETPPLTLQVDVIGDRPRRVPVGRPPTSRPRSTRRDSSAGRRRVRSHRPTRTSRSSLGIPAVAIGAGGRGGDTHTTREWYDNRDGTFGLVRAMTVLVAAAGTG